MEKDDQLMDTARLGWIKMFSCNVRLILFYVLYVTFINDKLNLNAVYIAYNSLHSGSLSLWLI